MDSAESPLMPMRSGAATTAADCCGASAQHIYSPGAIVAALQSGGPAATAGTAAGDSIEAIAGKSISSADDVATVLATLSVGQKVTVTFTSQDGARSTVTVTLGRLAAGKGRDADIAGAASATELAARQLELARAYARYQALLGEAGLIDFGDQVSLALRLLRESPAARQELERRYRYILVDEFQDTNQSQAELVALLAAGHRNVTVVGDDDQSVYRFRGAAISNILGFRERYRRSRLVVLRRNYRSRSGILAASHRLIRHNDPDRLEVRAGISKRLRAERPDPPAGRRTSAVRHEAFATGSDEADWIAAEILARVGAGACLADHAVLVRTNAGAEPILRSLNMAGLPWRFSGASGLYARPEVRLLLGFLRTVADLASSVDLYGLAAGEVYGLHGPDLTSIVNAARRRNRSLWDVLEELDRQPGVLRISADSRSRVTQLKSLRNSPS